MNRKLPVLIPRAVAAALLCAVALGAAAQADKSIVPEAVPAFPTFNLWFGSLAAAEPEPPVVTVMAIPITVQGAATQTSYQPQPVIMGQPDFMLIGAGANQAVSKGWGSAWNLQGVQMRLVVLDARGVKRELRSMAGPLRTGDRFKIRMTSTFDAVAQVDQVSGDLWYGKRTGQVYPQPGSSVMMKAGETVDLPLGSNEFFLMQRSAQDRLVLSVRHPKAVGDARSNQPAYRQDSKSGSGYIQMVTRGAYPAIEQLVAPGR